MSQFIYILTDNNRKNLHVGLTHNLPHTMAYCKEMHNLFFDSSRKTSRLVYFEEVSAVDQGLERFKEVSRFTRLQKEKLIRKANANWSDLSVNSGINSGFNFAEGQYSALVFAS